MTPAPRLLDRRRFLKHSSVAASAIAAAPSIVPASVLGANPPSETVRMGLIGTHHVQIRRRG